MAGKKKGFDTEAFRDKVAVDLKKLREGKYMSPEKIEAAAAEMGNEVSGEYVYKIERRGSSPTLEKLAVILHTLDVTIGQFFSWQTEAAGDDPDKYYHVLLKELLENDKSRRGTIGFLQAMKDVL